MTVTQNRPSSLPRATLLALAAGAVLIHSPAHADGPSEARRDGTQWGLGLAVMSESSPYRGVDTRTRVVPAVLFENRWVRFFGPSLELKLGPTGPVRWSLLAKYSEDGYEAGDSAALAGMAERKSSVWLGARAVLPTEWAQLSATWSADASSHSKGQRLSLSAERRFAVGHVGVSPRLSVHWSDSKATQYYYGVESGEATATRSAYRPGASVDTELGLRLDYRLAPQQMLFADLGLRALGSEVKDSPLVGRSSLPEVRLGYLYRF
ncbi:MipA/OmpV family protein [Sphaerotilus sulfidivorans]|uniref:MipA/OmpV family protein n=1 Tax=Sphaerotilus sulfidivorans TaxID=639200 RepID=UPI0030811A64